MRHVAENAIRSLRNLIGVKTALLELFLVAVWTVMVPTRPHAHA